MLNHVAAILLVTSAVRSDSSFIFPDEVPRYNIGSRQNDNTREGFTSYGNSFSDQRVKAHRHGDSNFHVLGNTDPTVHVLGVVGNRPSGHGHNRYPGYSGNHHGNRGFGPGYGSNFGYDNRPLYPGRPDYGGIVSQSQANAQSTGSGSSSGAQSGSQFFNQISQSSAQSQSQSSYPFGPSDGSGASSASSAASATTGIVNGVAVASAAAAAASAGSGNGGAGSAAVSASSSSSGIPSGFDAVPNEIPPWYFRNRIADDDANAGNRNTVSSSSGLNEDTIVFSVK